MSDEQNRDGVRPRPPHRPKGTVDGAPRHDDRTEIEVGLYPDDMRRLSILCQVRGETKSEVIRWAIARAYHHVAE